MFDLGARVRIGPPGHTDALQHQCGEAGQTGEIALQECAVGQDQANGRAGEGSRLSVGRCGRDGAPAHAVGDQGGGDALREGATIAIHEAVMERGPHGAEEVIHVLAEPSMRDATSGERRCGAAQHGNEGEETLPPDGPTAPQAALGGFP